MAYPFYLDYRSERASVKTRFLRAKIKKYAQAPTSAFPLQNAGAHVAFDKREGEK
jgi:hypothetical protein